MARSVKTSDLLKYRTTYQTEERMEKMKEAIKNKDFQELGKLIMMESNSLHAICQDTYPPIEPPYLSEFSRAVMKLVHKWNKKFKTIKV